MNSEQKKESILDESFIVPSVLDVRASEECEKSVASDLSAADTSTKSISELLDEKETTEEENNQKIDQ